MGVEEFDEDVLSTAIERQPVLAALADEPHHRRDLQHELDLSKTTCHRIVRSFDEKGLLCRTDQGYELTALGRAVERQVDRFDRTVRATYRLAPLVEAVASAPVEFDVELFADARVTRPEPGDPSPPLDRSLELFRETETLRHLDGAEYSPSLYLDEAFEIGVEKGMQGEAILPASVVETRVREYPDPHRMMSEVEAGIRYWIHDDVPFGLAIHDDHLEVRAYDDETGAPLLLVDTDDPEAIAWAEAVYERYREAADPPSAVDSIPDWLPEPEIDL